VSLGRFSLRAEVGGWRAALGEEAGEDRCDEAMESNLGAVGLREREPEDEDELESIVEC
jgi:hypothetical protein